MGAQPGELAGFLGLRAQAWLEQWTGYQEQRMKGQLSLAAKQCWVGQDLSYEAYSALVAHGWYADMLQLYVLLAPVSVCMSGLS